jgi:hypothetical protein
MDTGNDRLENEPLPGGDDYLWDGSGAPDPEIRKLESLLGKFRHDRPAPAVPAVTGGRRWRISLSRFRLFRSFAATAATVAVIAALLFLTDREKPTPPTTAGWGVSRVSGAPRIGKTIISPNEKTGRLDIGEMLETDSQSRASLHADNVGQIDVDPSTRLRLLSMASGLKRLALDRGTIHAFIWATPGQFIVDTPSALTVDLGCAYALQVDDSGAGLVRTSLGWVGFKLNGRESFIPAGAACATRPQIGPGTPYFEDASPALRAALARFDFDDGTSDGTSRKRDQDIAIVIAESRKRDALTLWHMLARVDETQRKAVYDRLKVLAPPPAGVTKEGILHLDQPMLDLWWNRLGFDDISVWRRWERSWSGAPAPVREK